MKKQCEIIKKVLKEEGSVRFAVSVQGPHAGTWGIWGKHICTGEENSEVCRRWKKELRHTAGGTCTMVEGDRVFVQDYVSSPDMVILGGGHISKSLVSLGKMLGFRVILADDRPEFASTDRFPQADLVLCEKYEEVFSKIPVSSEGYYVVVTRGHQGDETCVRQILKRSFRYVGMIGSRKKVEQTRKNLEQDGISADLLERLHAPVGIRIGAVTPEEIAVSIAAEIIQVKNQSVREVMSADVFEALMQPEKKILVMIVEKHGSSPRGAGACMVVGREGIVAGSVGGGTVEFEACRYAGRMLADHKTWDLKRYELNNIRSAELGMICGGSNEIVFLRI